MLSTFNLKEPKKEGETLILFSAYFKKEGKKFVYSTGEVISPLEWDFKNRQPNNLTGKTSNAEKQRSVKRQLDRYSKYFIERVNKYKDTGEELSIEMIRKDFDIEFQKTKTQSKDFFAVYDIFIQMKKNDRTDDANSKSTIKRYEYNKTLLEQYQEYSKTSLHLNRIDKPFYNSYITFCISEKKHSNNTLSRNLGLLKTFLSWAFDNNYTYKTDFRNFKNIRKQVTDEVALTYDQIIEIFEYDFTENTRLEKVRDLFVFGCFTGMRFSNYSIIKRNDIYDGIIHVRDKKDSSKQLSIPLNDYTKFILEKYDYQLPDITNQKFNDYVKEVAKEVGFKSNIKKTMKLGQDIIETVSPLYKRISSHTARRSFISIMKTNKIPDKVIMSFTGHKSIEVFNQYYKPVMEEKVDFMQSVFNMDKSKYTKP
ncbi:tyrosine-type recombinase/integrase [Flavobacterium sp. GNP002]